MEGNLEVSLSLIIPALVRAQSGVSEKTVLSSHSSLGHG